MVDAIWEEPGRAPGKKRTGVEADVEVMEMKQPSDESGGMAGRMAVLTHIKDADGTDYIPETSCSNSRGTFKKDVTS